MKKFTVSQSDNGIRLDRFLFKTMPSAPAGAVFKALRKKRVKVGGRHVTDGAARLKTGDELELYINDEFFESGNASEPDWMRCKIIPEIVYEDENIAVMLKPSGLPSQDPPDLPACSLESGFRKLLRGRGALDTGAAYIPSLCHRIDRNTSGLVIGAKNLEVHRIITEKIAKKEIKKFYVCIAEGRLEPRRGEISGYIEKVGPDRVRFNKEKRGKPAALKYNVTKYANGMSVVEIELLTGRTHQIRAMLAALGHPIAGDIKYGAKTRRDGYQELTASRIVFDFKTEAGVLNYLSGKTIEI